MSCFFFAGCLQDNFFEATLNVCNKSSKDIALYLGFDSVIPISDASVKKGIASGESCVLVGSGNSLKGLLKDTGHDHITILVFDMDTLKSYQWNEIVGGSKVWQEIELSYEQVKNCGTYINIWD